ncbi:MAG: ABC-F family ATP-binding cassette domain-containing protein [Hyphomonadaceae bacterium]|nr:ABC-F family ATP-binding cassette domain-containing protein [Hyphomonadaceae bacterium]
MAANIVVSRLGWSTPEGRSLFSDLDLSFGAERAGLVGCNGVGKSTLLKLITGELSPRAGSVTVQGHLGVLRQDMRPGEGETIARAFGAETALALLARAEAGQASADDLAQADWTLEARIIECLARVGLEAHMETPLAALSGGQQARVRLAALLFAEPDFLLLDEPTNNLDAEGRAAIAQVLANWRGGAIVISHDRALLDTMDAIVELTSLGAKRYGGNWTAYRERKALELAAAERDLVEAERRVGQVDERAQAAVERQARRDRAGRAKAMRGDIPKIITGAMKRNAENTKAESTLIAERRRAQALEDVAEARQRLEVLAPFSVDVPPTGLAAGKVVLRLDQVCAGYEPARLIIEGVSATIVGPERVALVGPNGSGKTTLLAVLTGRLEPWSGEARLFASYALLDQHVSLLNPADSIRDNFRRLNPDSDENACRAALARFKFRADAALQLASTLSGGEMLRAGLACVLGVKPPQLLILDEPTNHLDIDSIEVLEAGLRAFDGALLVVSHDEAFLSNIGVTRRLELPG